MTAQEIRSIIEKEEYEFFGLRIDETDLYNVGDECFCSHQWWQDPQEEDLEYNEKMQCWDGGELDGTCAIQVTEDNIDQAIEAMDMYYGKVLYLIAGNYAEGGNDIGEIIIESAVVLAKSEME